MTEIKTRNARNRRAGARWQTDLRNGLRAEGMDIERLALTGVQDEGDHVIRAPRLHVPQFLVIEAKAGALHATDFVRQAHQEAAHFAAHRGLDPRSVGGVAITKRRGASWLDAFVLTSVRQYFGIGA